MSVFSVSGYFVEPDRSKCEFDGLLITDYSDVPDGYDEDTIYLFGMSEQAIKDSIENPNDEDDFIITSYQEEK
jgi:hypothetical protein